MTALALRSHTGGDAAANALSREEVLSRYRRLRAISRRRNSNMMPFVSRDAILQNARRLGLAHGKTLILDSEDELTFALDLAIYTTPSGRTRAIDRYARSVQPAPGSDEARMLQAMCNSRFAIAALERQHEAAGLIVTDLIRGGELWLVDIGLEQSMPDGSVLATRVYLLDDFAMTAGVFVPLDADLLAAAISELPHSARKSPRQAIDDRRLAESLYRVALADGWADQVRLHDVVGEAG
jgi:hypothetical protein